MADPHAAEVAGTAGFDWLLIDGEHAPNDVHTTMAQLQVIEPGASAPIVRLRDDDPAPIKQVLDAGAQSLLIPMIESADQAERCLRATRYPTEGFRGVDGRCLALWCRSGARKYVSR